MALHKPLRDRDARRKAQIRGVLAEAFCRLYLRLTGYSVLASGDRTKLGEIDIVARRGGTLAFVEVKLRPNMAQALDAVTVRQQRRVVNAGALFLQSHPQFAEATIRFDLFALAPWRLPVHIRGAWRADT